MNANDHSAVTILLVEPSATQALKLKRLLGRLGFGITVARNAEEAWVALDGGLLPRLVLCDVGLPGVDGYALCGQIRAREDVRDLPVVLLTSFLDPLGAVRALQCGADDLLPRVFEEETLLPHISDILLNLERRERGNNADVVLEGVSYPVSPQSDPRALQLLLSSYRVAMHRSEELRQAQDALERQAEGMEHVEGTEQALAPPPTPSESPMTLNPELQKPTHLRVLLAEDSEVNQRLAARTLERNGWHAVLAVNGEEALHAWGREPFDLILMDVEMPVMDGLAATRAIRAREAGSGRHVPIVAMTAHSDPENRQRCLDAGMDACLSKPLQMAAVLAALPPPPAQTDAAPPALVTSSPAGVEAAGDQPAVFERERALARLDGDEDLLRELMGIFRVEAPALLSQAQEALAAQDAHRLERAAHSLKGSAASLGAPALAAAAARLEAAGRGALFAEAAGALAEVQAALAALTPLLQEP